MKNAISILPTRMSVMRAVHAIFTCAGKIVFLRFSSYRPNSPQRTEHARTADGLPSQSKWSMNTRWPPFELFPILFPVAPAPTIHCYESATTTTLRWYFFIITFFFFFIVFRRIVCSVLVSGEKPGIISPLPPPHPSYIPIYSLYIYKFFFVLIPTKNSLSTTDRTKRERVKYFRIQSNANYNCVLRARRVCSTTANRKKKKKTLNKFN